MLPKWAQILEDEAKQLEKSVELLYDGLSYPQELSIMEADEDLQVIYQALYDGIEDLENYVVDIRMGLEEYSKPSIKKQPLWETVERGLE